MSINRRILLASGASIGALTLLGCNPSDDSSNETPQEPEAQTPVSDAGGTTDLYDGSQVEPLSSEPIMNPVAVKDRPIGGKGAKVTVVEYASPTCPHCAAFHLNVYPDFKEQYVDTGKVTFIVRPFLRNVLDAVVFMLAEAAGADGYYQILDVYFHNQNQWALSEKPRDAIMAIALQQGFTEESFDAALTNQALFDGMEKLKEQALNEFELTGTPTFYINGEKLSGEQSIENLAAQIDPLLG